MTTSPLNVLVAIPPHPPALDTVRALAGGQVDLVEPFPLGTEFPAAQLAPYHILLSDLPPQNLADMRSLQWIQLGSAGYEQILRYPLRDRGVVVTNASGVNDVPIAEWCLTMMVLFERDVLEMLDHQRHHIWERKARYQSELRGRRVGIIGYGNIGREVARLATAYGLEVWVMARHSVGPRPNRYAVPGTGDPDGILPQRSFTFDQMADFLPHLDYVVLTLPNTPTTRGLFTDREFGLMAPHAVLLNPARAVLIEEAALLRALRDGRIHGAALDVHFQFPLPPEHPLWDMPNVILTPNVSGSSGSRHYLARIWDIFAQNLHRYRAGQPLLNQIAPSDLA